MLDAFVKAFPDVEKDNAAQVNHAYFQAYRMQGNLDKTVEYGDKVIAADPNNVVVVNTMGLIYAFYLPNPSIDKAAGLRAEGPDRGAGAQETRGR